jgi:hypothetical protein
VDVDVDVDVDADADAWGSLGSVDTRLCRAGEGELALDLCGGLVAERRV